MNDREPYIVVERGNSGMGAFVIGALIGAGAALLLAPKSGRETQDELRDQAKKWKGVAEERLKDAQSVVETRIEQAREGVTEKIGTVREAVEAGRQAAVDARVDLEDKLERSKAAYRAGIDAARSTAQEGKETPVIES